MKFNSTHLLLGGLGALFLGILMLMVIYFSMSNGEIRQRNLVMAKQVDNKAVFDNTWKIVSETASLPESAKEAFKEIYQPMMQARYENDKNLLAKFITEQNPQFDMSLYKDLARVIETQRTIFTNEQRKLIDLKREHDNMLDTFPGSLVLAGRQKIEIKVVTSTRTEKSFETERDDEPLVKAPSKPVAAASPAK